MDMAQSIEESLLKAIQKDDIKAFNALMEKKPCGAYRLGRFPVLSLMYLYKSRKLLSAHEQSFLKITKYEELYEPISIYKKFSAYAGKCARLYFSEIISPLEMLLILNRTGKLKRVYPSVKPSAEVKGRLKSIYSIKYALNIKFEGENIIIDRRPLSYGEKKRIALSCLCTFLAVSIIVGVPVTTVSLMPKLEEGDVTKLSHIDFTSYNVYTLKKDITLPENFSVEKVNCTITGGGHKLKFGKGASLGVFNGKMSDIIVESSGDPIFTTISESAEIKNITVNVSASVTTDKSSALVAMTNYGTIDGVTVNVGGSVSAVGTDNDVTLGAVVQTNAFRTQYSYGIISDCTVNFSDFTLSGEAEADAAFGGIAGINRGALQNCTVTGKITADTFDIAGVCVGNNGLITGNINEADLSQTSANSGWNPIACGIVLQNVSTVQYCENRGNITSVSVCGQTEDNSIAVTSAGVAYINGGTVGGCVNSGAISAEGNDTAVAGGICAIAYSSVLYCLSSGDITVKAQTAFTGGILGRSEIVSGYFNSYIYDFVRYCISESKISVTADSEKSCVGGVVGFVVEKESESLSNIYFGGGVTDCYFIGECVNEVKYFGNIVGGVGANIYASNSYTLGFTEYHNFEGNYFIENSLPAFGALVSGDEYSVAEEDKGAVAQSEEEIKNSEGYKKILDKLLNF